MNVLDSLRDPHLFGALPAFRDLETWRAWEAFLAAAQALEAFLKTKPRKEGDR